MNLLSKIFGLTRLKKPNLTRMSWEEEYLSQATDLVDLERRQRRLTRGEVANNYIWQINQRRS